MLHSHGLSNNGYSDRINPPFHINTDFCDHICTDDDNDNNNNNNNNNP